MEICRVAAHPQLVIPTGSKTSISVPRVLRKRLMIREETQPTQPGGLHIHLLPPGFPRSGPGYTLLHFSELSHQTTALHPNSQFLHSCTILKNYNHHSLESFHSTFIQKAVLEPWLCTNPSLRQFLSSKSSQSLRTHRLAIIN